MGEYFLWVNLSKKEYIHPHELGSGAKLPEWCGGPATKIMPLILAKRWAGDRTIMLGDEDETGLYDKVTKGIRMHEFNDITREVVDEFNEFVGHYDLRFRPLDKDDSIPGCMCMHPYPLNPNKCEDCYWIEECRNCSP